MPTLPFIQDTHLPVPMASPDWSFLSGQVARANQQYQEGLQEVKSDYSAILSADVTNEENKAKKQEYVQQVNEGLKRIAGLDVSDPKVMREAENIMAPFWQDNALLTDISFTKFKNSEIQKGLAVQYSKDEDIRKTFNPASIELLQRQLNGVNGLKYMNRSEIEKNTLAWDVYTPGENIQSVLGKHKKDDGFEVVQEMRDGNGTIVKVINGPSSISNYKVYAHGILGKTYNNHYNVLAKLDVQRQLDSYVERGIPKEEAKILIGESEYPRVVKGYEDNINALTTTIAQKEQDLDSINKNVARAGGIPLPNQEDARNKLGVEIANYKQMYTQLTSSYKDLLTPEGKKGFMLQPEANIANRYRQDDINSWAYSMSQDVSQEIKSDQAFWEGKKLQKDYATLTETSRHNMATEENAAANTQIAAMKLQAEYPDIFGRNRTSTAPGGQYSGKSINEIKEEDKLEAAQAKRNQTVSTVYNSIYNPSGLTSLLYNKAGVTNTDVDKFTEFMNSFYNGSIEIVHDKNGKPSARGASPDLLKSFWKIAGYLGDQTGINTSTIEGAHSALLGLVAKEINNTTAIGAEDPNKINQIKNLWNSVKTNLDIIRKDDNQRSDNLINYVNTQEGSRFKNLVVKTPTGTRYVEDKDMVKDFPKLILRDINTRQDIPISATEHAKLYREGAIKPDANGEIFMNGKKYLISGFGDKLIDNQGWRPPVADYNNWYNTVVKPKYGSPTELVEGIKYLQQKTLPGTQFYNDANNIIGGRFTYSLDKESKVGKENIQRLDEIIQPGNYVSMYTMEQGKRPQISPETQTVIQNMVSDPDYSKYIGRNFYYNISSFNGKPMVEVKISDDIPKTAPDKYKELKGKTILIEKNPSAKGRYLQEFPEAVDYSFHPLNRGETITSDPIDNAVGRGNYSITPWPKNNPTQYIVHMTKDLVNNKTGKVEKNTTTVTVPVAGTDVEKFTSDVRQVLYANGNAFYQQLNILKTNLNKK